MIKEDRMEIYQIGMNCSDFKPDEILSKKKLDFNDPEFWFAKGYKHFHSANNEYESAIDSYRAAIRKKPLHVESMHNMACVYEK